MAYQALPDGTKPAIKTGRYHALAEAMRRGCALRPVQIKHALFNGEAGACALGAVYSGTGDESLTLEQLYRVYYELADIVTWPVNPDLAYTVIESITYLNDYHGWTREQIADWLDTLGQPEVKGENRGDAL